MKLCDAIESALRKKFPRADFTVVDETHLGNDGWSIYANGDDHWYVVAYANAFADGWLGRRAANPGGDA